MRCSGMAKPVETGRQGEGTHGGRRESKTRSRQVESQARGMQGRTCGRAASVMPGKKRIIEEG